MNNILVQAPRLLNKYKKCKRFITSYQTKIRKEVFIMSIELYNINEEYREKFYQIPKVFFTNPKYIKLSNDAKMAWGILRDRLDLSIKNGWVDSKTGNIYFYYKNENLQTILNCKKDKVIKIKKELIEVELLLQERQGLNKTNKLYLVKLEVTEDDIYKIQKQENTVESSNGKEVDKTESNDKDYKEILLQEFPEQLTNYLMNYHYKDLEVIKTVILKAKNHLIQDMKI